MKKKIMVAVMLTMMLTINAFAAPALMTVNAETASAADVFTYGESKIEKITEPDGTEHPADLTAWDGSAAAEAPSTTVIDEVTYYQIEDGADLAWFANFVNTNTGTTDAAAYANVSANAILVNDIDLGSKNWKNFRIGIGAGYAGTFDGNGHTIYNFYISATSPANEQGGLFREITTGAVVKKLNFVNAKTVSSYTANQTSTTYTSIVCGDMSGGTIENVNVSGLITVSGSGKYANTVGSIASRVTAGTIKNCYSDATIDLSASGGTGPAKGTAVGGYGVGGIVGLIYKGSSSTTYATIENCGFEGFINAPYNSRVGGIAGHESGNSEYFKIINCYNTADIIGLRQVAGILGWANTGVLQKASVFQYNYNTGDIIAKSNDTTYAAGLINGYIGYRIATYCYSTGDVYVDDGSTTTFNDKCALIGTYASAPNSSTSTTNVKAVAMKRYLDDSTTDEKPLLSDTKGQYTVDSCANAKTYTATEFENGTALNKLGTTYYAQLAGLNGNYPVLKWQTTAPLAEANTYYLSGEDTLTLTLDRAGSVAIEIIPLGTGSEVTAAGKTVTEKGTHTFKSTGTTLTVSVTGSALIKRSLMNQKSGQSIGTVEPEIIRFNADTTGAGVVIFALYDGVTGNVRKTVKYTDFSDMIIDLTNEDTTGCTLKVFLWKDLDEAEPVAAPYILEPAEVIDHSAGIAALDGKKVIFIGNSHIYWGKTVNHKGNNVPALANRTNDKGGFYKLCKANGIDVSVTNWTFAGHSLSEIFSGAVCTDTQCVTYATNANHVEELTDREYDYVFISPGSVNNGERFLTTMDTIMTMFTEANPDVKFILLSQATLRGINADGTVYDQILDCHDDLEALGVTIADWGYIVEEAMNNGVEGSNQDYVKSSFIVKDQYHPNLLSGYITTVAAYCAVTGESAVIQPHSYVSDFDIPAYAAENYDNGDADTNFPEILGSAYEMRLLKKHIDTYK